MTLQVKNLSCVRQQKILFADISFHLNSGTALLVEGPNGSGKSSLLKLLTGLSTPAAGDIYWKGKSLSLNHADYWENLHYVGHTNGVRLGLTVAENLQLMGHLTDKKLSDSDAALSHLQLAAHKNTQAKYLSAGQKRRLALAKLFLVKKTLWILDEPFTALDAATQEFLLMQLENHLLNGGICIISSHHPIIFKKIPAQTLRLEIC